MWTNWHETVDLFTFTKEIPDGKLPFLCSEKRKEWNGRWRKNTAF